MKRKASLRSRLILIVILCWVIPILAVITVSGYLLHRDYERSVRQEIELTGNYAAEQIADHFSELVFASKSVSYDGSVRSAYRTYELDGDEAKLYRNVSTYMSQRFFGNQRSIPAAFITFRNHPDMRIYVSNQPDDRSRQVLASFDEVRGEIVTEMKDADTSIVLVQKEDRLYLCRNLLNSYLKPYATVVLLCGLNDLVKPLSAPILAGSWVEIDGRIRCNPNGIIVEAKEYQGNELICEQEAEGHLFTVHCPVGEINLMNDSQEIRLLLCAILLFLILVLLLTSLLFHRQVSAPVQTLINAYGRLQTGERGYAIEKKAENREFDALYSHFNRLSREIKNQFDSEREEQKMLQQARIKALQSQINPHFLNNTLEVINWEARMQGNTHVSEMIEALSTLMSGTLNRDGISRVKLSEEMKYVEAYLFIIQQRMGDRLQVSYEIDPSLNDVPVPRLVLQPVVENAVEHDLTRLSHGNLAIRIRRDGSDVLMEVEHDGTMTEEDQKAICLILSGEPEADVGRSHIGLRNVSQRLQLMYHDQAQLTITQLAKNRILARIRFELP